MGITGLWSYGFDVKPAVYVVTTIMYRLKIHGTFLHLSVRINFLVFKHSYFHVFHSVH